MANLYDTTNKSCSSSSAVEPDDISLFLQQFLLRSSGSAVVENRESGSGQGRVSVTDLYSGPNLPAAGCFPTAAAVNVSSSSVGTLDNDPDDYDGESEEATEASVEEAALLKHQRNTSKRSRAAEVHNLSEKRRRSRINEKMKALQNLIPNSNKTDKASMLDEAIDYLKQLQLQVQMLTVRNGLSAYPICPPGTLQSNQIPQLRPDCYQGSRSMNVKMRKAVPIDQETSSKAILGLQDSSVERMAVTEFSTMINPRAVSRTESMIQAHFGPDQLLKSSQDEVLSFEHRDKDCPSSTLRGYVVGSEGNSLLPFDVQPSNIISNTLENSCFIRGDLSGGHMNLPSVVNSSKISPHFTGLDIEVLLSRCNGKSEGKEFCFDDSA